MSHNSVRKIKRNFFKLNPSTLIVIWNEIYKQLLWRNNSSIKRVPAVTKNQLRNRAIKAVRATTTTTTTTTAAACTYKIRAWVMKYRVGVDAGYHQKSRLLRFHRQHTVPYHATHSICVPRAIKHVLLQSYGTRLTWACLYIYAETLQLYNGERDFFLPFSFLDGQWRTQDTPDAPDG